MPLYEVELPITVCSTSMRKFSIVADTEDLVLKELSEDKDYFSNSVFVSKNDREQDFYVNHIDRVKISKS